MQRQYLLSRHKLIQAVRVLAIGPEDMRRRLPGAYPVLAELSTTDLPEVLREDFEWVMSRLTAREPRWRGTDFWETPAEASVAGMRNNTAVRIAERIFYISERLRDIAAGD